MNRTRAILFSGLMLAWPCAGPAPRSAQPNSAPLPVPHPSLELVGDVVQAHVREERRQFEAILGQSPAPSSAQIAQAYSRLARVYHAYGFESAALACYLNLDRCKPGIYPCQYAIGRIYHHQGRFDEALRRVGEAKRIASQLPDTPPSVLVAMNCLMGDSALKLGMIPEAMRTFQEALKQDPGCAYAWHGMGLVYSLQEDSSAAIKCLERAMELQPRASLGRVLLAREYRRKGQLEKAAAILPTSDDRQPIPFAFYDPILARDVAPLNRSASSAHSQALSAKRRGHAGRAIELFEKAIELNPYFTTAKANLAGAYLSEGRLAEAETLARQVVEDKPRDPSFQDLLGVSLLQQGRFPDALRAFQRATELAPEEGAHWFWSGAALSWMGDHEAALEAFDRAAKWDPAHCDAQIGAAVMAARMGEETEAVERLRRCVDRFPGSAAAKLYLARALAAGSDITATTAERSLALATSVYEQQKTIPAAVAVAMARAAAGQFSEAAEIQEWAVQQSERRGSATDLPWLKRNLLLYKSGEPSREPWDEAGGYPRLMASTGIEE